jgi:multiple sugar transport system ATP-binding protein
MTLGDRVAVLRDGTIQQCDTPEQLFEAPANVFVAAFMGSPPMNLVAAEASEGKLKMAGVELPLTARHDGPVIAGVRPTDLKPVGPDSDPGLPRLPVEVEVVERLGAESHLIFPVDAPKLAGEAAIAADEATEDSDATLLAADNRARFTARVEGRRRFKSGEAVEFTVPPDAVHLFDAETGEALR